MSRTKHGALQTQKRERKHHVLCVCVWNEDNNEHTHTHTLPGIHSPVHRTLKVITIDYLCWPSPLENPLLSAGEGERADTQRVRKE